ncbi:MAG: translation initiation factor IF-2 [Archaeoglobus sp.]|nr:MAG: translation initiation factor IF-2 [Archaeoglobus sp.]
MLPKELLNVKKLRGKIYPKFADSDDKLLAEKIIEIFKSGLGKKYGEVMTALKRLENADNYKKLRGFVRVLETHCVERACSFADTDLEPYKVRLFLFERGFVTSKSERDRIISYAAKYFNVDPDDVEKAMYADREEELIISKVDEIDANKLIKMYNLSLLQTALFNSTTMKFEVEGNYKYVFRAIKFLGLMYDILKAGKMTEVEVIGPASTVKMTKKYGTSMAKLLPYIISAEKWKIDAKILEGDRLYELKVDSSLKHMFPEFKLGDTYDSSLEEEFYRRMRNLGYLVEREPGVIDAGGKAFVPDFAVWREGWSDKVYIEIAGFWTENYIKRKIEKVKNSGVPLIVVAREEFGDSCDVGSKPEVVLFSKRINYGEVVRAINRIVKTKSGFEKVGIIVEERTIKELKNELERIKPKTIEELERLIESKGLRINEILLKKLGIKIIWKGLNCTIEIKD